MKHIHSDATPTRTDTPPLAWLAAAAIGSCVLATVASTAPAAPVQQGPDRVIAWNDLGMSTRAPAKEDPSDP